MRLSENFRSWEFACKCNERGLYHQDRLSYCGGLSIADPELIGLLQNLRWRVGKPVIIHSGYRCPAYNRRIEPQGVGGAEWSQHMNGKAADISVPDMLPKEVVEIAQSIGFTFIGLYDTFTHVDVRESNQQVTMDFRRGV